MREIYFWPDGRWCDKDELPTMPADIREAPYSKLQVHPTTPPHGISDFVRLVIAEDIGRDLD